MIKNKIIYNYNIGAPGHLTVEVRPQSGEANQRMFKITWLSRFIWGIGAAANSVYNAYMPVKFQADKETNQRRARLLVKLFRYCESAGIDIMKLPENKNRERYSNPEPEEFEHWVQKLQEIQPH